MSEYQIRAFGPCGDEFVVVDKDGRIMAKGSPSTYDRYGSWKFGNDAAGRDEFVDRMAALTYARKAWGVKEGL